MIKGQTRGRVNVMENTGTSSKARRRHGWARLGLLVLGLLLSEGMSASVRAQSAGAGPAPGAAPASKGIGLYTWVDEKGNYHMVDSLGAVPSKFRPGAKARAEKGELAGGNAGGNYTQVKDAGKGSTGAGDTTGTGAGSGGAGGAGAGGTSQKPASSGTEGAATSRGPATDASYWAERIRAAETLRDEAVAELAGLDAETLRLRTLTPMGFQQALLDAEAKRAHVELVKTGAERELQETIPADARRMGVPPGWLR